MKDPCYDSIKPMLLKYYTEFITYGLFKWAYDTLITDRIGHTGIIRSNAPESVHWKQR